MLSDPSYRVRLGPGDLFFCVFLMIWPTLYFMPDGRWSLFYYLYLDVQFQLADDGKRYKMSSDKVTHIADIFYQSTCIVHKVILFLNRHGQLALCHVNALYTEWWLCAIYTPTVSLTRAVDHIVQSLLLWHWQSIEFSLIFCSSDASA